MEAHLNFLPPPSNPPDIYPLLLERGITPHHARAISERYLNHAIPELQRQIASFRKTSGPALATLSQVLKDLPDFDRTPVRLDLSNIFNEMAQKWVNIAVEASEKAKKQREAKPTNILLLDESLQYEFRHEYTTFLLKYFEFNPFPSTTDKELIAKKSLMSARRIEIWFQNRRRRLRRRGIELSSNRCTTDPLFAEASRKFILEHMPTVKLRNATGSDTNKKPNTQSTLGPDIPKSTVSERPRNPVADRTTSDILNLHTPQWPAIPVPYSRLATKAPCRARFPSPQWARTARSSASAAVRSALATVRDLRRAFKSFKVTSEDDDGVDGPPSGATFGIYVVPKPAPLPSLVITPLIIPSPPSTLRGMNTLDVSRHNHTAPSGMAPSAAPFLIRHQRKIAGLPKRLPESGILRRSSDANGLYTSTSYAARSSSPPSVSTLPALEPSIRRQASVSSIDSNSLPPTPDTSTVSLPDVLFPSDNTQSFQTSYGDIFADSFNFTDSDYTLPNFLAPHYTFPNTFPQSSLPDYSLSNYSLPKSTILDSFWDFSAVEHPTSNYTPPPWNGDFMQSLMLNSFDFSSP